jgi:hypothetical protein
MGMKGMSSAKSFLMEVLKRYSGGFAIAASPLARLSIVSRVRGTQKGHSVQKMNNE